MKFTLAGLIVTLCILLFSGNASSQQVSGKFLTSRGNIIKTHIQINGQPPQSLIVEQHIPKGTSILSTKPSAQKVNSNTGTIKWFFKNPSAGDTILTIKVSPPLENKPRGKIKYLDQTTGKTIESRF